MLISICNLFHPGRSRKANRHLIQGDTLKKHDYPLNCPFQSGPDTDIITRVKRIQETLQKGVPVIGRKSRIAIIGTGAIGGTAAAHIK
jgi:hypothetical protein